MKAEDMREWDDVEIRARLEELRTEQFRFRMQSATMELENPNVIKSNRRDIARLLTILKERESATEVENG